MQQWKMSCVAEQEALKTKCDKFNQQVKQLKESIKEERDSQV